MATRMTYEETMSWGASQYADVIARLETEGFPLAEFVQTGGMCAAIEVQLETGHTLLLTDADDTLSWARAEQLGWGVGMYPPGEAPDGAISYAQDSSNDVDTLIRLMIHVLQQGVAATRRI